MARSTCSQSVSSTMSERAGCEQGLGHSEPLELSLVRV